MFDFKGGIYHPVNNYNYVEDTQVIVSIKNTNANKCTLSEIFVSEILKPFSAFYPGCRAWVVDFNVTIVDNLPVECNNSNLDSDSEAWCMRISYQHNSDMA